METPLQHPVNYSAQIGDLIIPVNSLTITARGTKHYTQITTNAIWLASEIDTLIGYANGLIISGGGAALAEFDEVSSTLQTGGRSGAITIQGTRVLSAPSALEYAISGISYQAAGSFRCVPDFRVLPGDTVTREDGFSFTVVSVAVYISSTQQQMELGI